MNVNQLHRFSNQTIPSIDNHYTSLFNEKNVSINQNSDLRSYFNHKTENNYSISNTDILTFSPTITIIIAIIAAIMSLGTIVGNVFVITAFIIEKNLRKYSNYFILNLSIADLLIGLLIPPYAPFLLYNRHWKIGRAACTIWLVFDYVVGSASVLCIVVISLDRYLMVSRGLNYMAGQKISKAICIMLTVWIIAFLNYAPAILFWEMISGRSTVKDGECQVEFHDNLAYLTATACVEFFVPFISICVLNLAVYLNIRRRSRGLIRSENPKFKLSPRNNTDKNQHIDNNNLDQTTKNLQTSFQSTKINSENENCTTNQKSNRTSLQIGSNNKLDGASIIDDDLDNQRSNASSYSASSCDEDESSTELKTKMNRRRQSSSSKRINSVCNVDSPLSNKTKEESKNLINKKNFSIVDDSNLKNGSFVVTSMTKSLNSNTIHKKPGTVRKNKKDIVKSKLKKDKKAARALFIFVFVFFICWAPYTLLTLIKSVCSDCINDHLYEFVFWLLWFNSTFNPILYSFLHIEFRRAFIRIIHAILCCFNFNKKTNKK